MIEFFASESNGVWSIVWQQFDEFGVFIDEGVVSGVTEGARHGVERAFRALWADLLVARLPFDKVSGALRVRANPRAIEVATGRRLLPSPPSVVAISDSPRNR